MVELGLEDLVEYSGLGAYSGLKGKKFLCLSGGCWVWQAPIIWSVPFYCFPGWSSYFFAWWISCLWLWIVLPVSFYFTLLWSACSGYGSLLFGIFCQERTIFLPQCYVWLWECCKSCFWFFRFLLVCFLPVPILYPLYFVLYTFLRYNACFKINRTNTILLERIFYMKYSTKFTSKS